MPIAITFPRPRHFSYSVEKIRNGHQITSPHAGAASEWAIPQPTALAKTANRGGSINNRISSTTAMINVSTNGANTTSSITVDHPLTGKLGPAACGNSDDTSTDSNSAGTVVTSHPTRIARIGWRGSSSAGNRDDSIN